jgi:predicted kinase
MSTGDYAGLAALRFYLVYRALVRAKVDLLRAGQDDPGARAEALRYVALAEQLSQVGTPRMLLMHGVSGSGKSRIAGELAESLGALWLRSDVERKRLFGLGPLDTSRDIPGGIYTAEAGRRTFGHLLDLARRLIADSYDVIVDATFLRQAHRRPFIALAQALAIDWRIVAVHAEADVLRRRVAERLARADDASEATLAILDDQLAELEPLTGLEQTQSIDFHADRPGAVDAVLDWLRT